MKRMSLLVVVVVSLVAWGAVGFAQQESIIRIAQSFPTNPDPGTGQDYSSTRIQAILYDSLVYPDISGSPTPHLAERWEESEDGLTYTFYLRSGVLFHDGTELTAEDVVFSMQRMLTMQEGWAFLYVGRIKSVEALDSYTVKVQLVQPFGPFVSTLFRFQIVNKDLVLANLGSGAFGDLGDYGRAFLMANDAGSGPYQLVDVSVSEYFLMQRFENYWGPMRDNPPEYVKFVAWIEPVTLRTMMSRRELEFSDQWQATETLDALDAIDGVDVAKLDVGGIFPLMLHTQKAPTDCIHVRRAISWATDYKTVYTQILPGYRQSVGPVSASLLGHDPDVFQYTYNMELAKEEIKKSKYYGELDKYPVTIFWSADVPFEEKLALMLQANWAELGLDVRPVKTPWMSYSEAMGSMEASPNVAIMFLAALYSEAGAQLDSRYSSTSAATVDQNEWLMDATFEAMLADAFATLDVEERYAKYAAIQHYIVGLAPTIFLVDDYTRIAYQSAYIDWPAARGEGIPLMGYEFDPRTIEVYPDRIP